MHTLHSVTKHALPLLFAFALVCPSSHGASAQDPQDGVNRSGLPQGTTREQMWYAPSAEDWKKPVLVTFQRSWEDAVAVARETGRPILVCVNMDGEIASEHYAGVRYRSPEIAKLYEPYVCVIASTYRHNPRDHDEHGHRIPCPRFGSVTCGEHISIEPLLYEKFMEGQRIAPRHIMVELDGPEGPREAFDVYLAFDTASVFKAIENGITNRGPTPPPIVRGDRPIVERVASRDVVDRNAVEEAYRGGDAQLRQALLDAAAEHAATGPSELLRLAVMGLDPDAARRARTALAQSSAESAVDVIAEALRVPIEAGEREALVKALERLGETSPRARTLAVVHNGLAGRSAKLDVDGWAKALEGGASYVPADRVSLEAKVEAAGEASRTRPDDAESRVARAEALLGLAVDPESGSSFAPNRRVAAQQKTLMLEDALRAALEAERLGATGWRVQSVIAIASWYLGKTREAQTRAEAAVGSLPADAASWNAAAVLALFAQSRQEAIIAAVRKQEQWPPQWMTDVTAAYGVLARHPFGTDLHVASNYDFLKYVGAMGRAGKALDEGLARFPDSAPLHDCLRARTLDERGADGLEKAYEAMLAKPEASKNLPWFAGYAALVAAEFHRRAGELDAARGAYERAIAHYDRAIAANPDNQKTADHYAAMALGALARMAYEAQDDAKAVELVVASFTRCPEAANALDGLNFSCADTSRQLLIRLRLAENTALADRVEAARQSLDPRLLEPPAYERIDPPAGGEARPRRRRG
jgi:tetratricopeptide (TPR) repeat protein